MALLAGAASAAKHPFVGEHADASAVQNDGGISMKLDAKPAGFNKHRGHITEDGLFEPNLGYFGRISESLFGTTETDLEKFAKQHSLTKKSR